MHTRYLGFSAGYDGEAGGELEGVVYAGCKEKLQEGVREKIKEDEAQMLRYKQY